MVTYLLPLTPMAFSIKELRLDDGSSPFGEWFFGLDGVAAAKVRVAVARMEQEICPMCSGSAVLANSELTGGPV